MFSFCKLIRMFPVHSRKIRILHSISHLLGNHGFIFIINFIQKKTVLHIILRMAQNGLSFQLKQNNRQGFLSGLHNLQLRIGFLPKQYQRAKTDTITTFQNLNVIIFHIIFHNRCNAGFISTGCPHPENIMISPFYVQRMVFH